MPEFVNIASGQNQSKLASQQISFHEIWDFHIYGMVGVALKEEIYFCGGGTWPSTCQSIDRIRSTKTCQSFNLKEYTLTHLVISMTEERSFAQSVRFENETWFILGGEDSEGHASDTTEYMNADGTSFMNGARMPEHVTRHCAKMINSTHLFITGGSRKSSSVSAYTFLPSSRGSKNPLLPFTQ